MGLYDREYTQDGFHSRSYGAPQMRIGLPRLTPVVKWLIIINVTVFLVSIIIQPLGVLIYGFFELDATSWIRGIQIWRLVTYQFLHDPTGFFHILFNMLGLYFLGPTLERYWGGKRFLGFYLGCGIAGGLFYLFLVAVGFLPGSYMVGASGAILGLLAACAILFPHFIVFFLFFPVPIRVAAIILTGIYVVTLATRGGNAGGDAAHLAGMAAGAAYVLSEPFRTKLKLKTHTGRWQKKINRQRHLQNEVDRILQKVHDHGIQSLTHREKKILKKATLSQQVRNKVHQGPE